MFFTKFRIRPIMKLIRMTKRDVLFNVLIFLSIAVNLLYPGSGNDENVSKAYLDPSTGSMIISAIVGVFATIVLGVKTFWYKIVSIFKHSKSNQPKKSDNSK